MIERIILAELCNDEEYTRKVIPFLKAEYFFNPGEKILFEKIEKHVVKYNSTPDKNALVIAVQEDRKVSEAELTEIEDVLKNLSTEKTNKEWLLNETEKFCKDKALYLAVMESIGIIDGKDKDKPTSALPAILSDALAMSDLTNYLNEKLAENEDKI